MVRSLPIASFVATLVIVFASLVACRDLPRAQAEPALAPAKSTPVSPASQELAPREPPRPVVERIRVPGDRPISLVRNEGRAPATVFLPGLCSIGSAYLERFPEALRSYGGGIALEGDVPCQGGFRSFSWDAGRQHARIEAALAASGLTTIPREGITIVGYSQGAAIAEQLAARYPERYGRVVLIGAPRDLSAERLVKVRGLVTMSCSRDVVSRMKEGAARARRASVPALYLEMPGCTHGDVADAERIFTEAFDFLSQSAREPPATALPAPLVGEADER